MDGQSISGDDVATGGGTEGGNTNVLQCRWFGDFRSWVIVLALQMALGLGASRAHALDITVSPVLAGKTPEIVGYNSGHFMPGSNTADWWRYSGVNGARVWATPSVVEQNPAVPGPREDDDTLWGDGVGTQQQFLERRALLRANPLSTTYINWPLIENNYQNTKTGTNNLYLNHAIGGLREMGIEPVMAIDRTNSRYFFNAAGTVLGWQDRWEQWQHFYAQAFYLAKNYDVSRFQMYNEPNHFSSPDTAPDVTPSEFVERLQFASDAVQAAIADVNAMYGKSLDPQMHAPVTAGGTSVYPAWGAPVMQKLHTNFLGQVDPDFQLVDTYAYQQYGQTGAGFASQLTSIKSSVNTAANGAPMRFALTEFSVLTAGNFDGTNDTLDTPSRFARMGSILAHLAITKADELYVQKFSQTSGTGPTGVKKNGTHFVDNNSAPYNIGGVTKGGEVVRLFAKGFAGANDMFNAPSGAADLSIVTSHNPDQDRYYILSANEASGAAGVRSLAINVGNWGIAAGSRVTVEEVSATRHGEISQILTVPSNGILNLSQPAQSVLLLSIPKTPSTHYISLGATDDAMVKSGTNAGVNYGASTNLFSKNDVVNPSARNVSFIKFNTGAIATSEIEQAILQVHGQNEGSADQVIAHVYGIADDQWNEATINWNNAPNLGSSLGTAVDDISENFIEGAGTSAQFVGNLTGVAASRSMSIDVTNFVHDHPNQEVTFLIAREVRFDGENVDDNLTSLRLGSKEGGADPGPQLLLSLSAYALAGDYDRNGVVDAGDYAVWQQSFSNTTNLAADGNRDGAVDAADYVIWRSNFGIRLPNITGGNAALAIPEPSCAILGCLALVWMWLARVR